MTNLEYYKDSLAYMLRDNGCILCNYFGKIKTYKDCKNCPYYDKNKDLCDYQKFVNWLLEEHIEKVKLKQWEKDLLDCEFDDEYRFEYPLHLYAMKKRGYFKDITDTSMLIREILDNCEVIDD